MNNPATRPQDELNEFTRVVMSRDGLAVVLLRNGVLVAPKYDPPEDETCVPVFSYEANGHSYCWWLNGQSVTSHDYDMMKILGVERQTEGDG